MRLHSTAASIEAEEFTWLAIAECLLATAIYVVAALHFHSTRLYALAIAFAPLALLRTDAAVTSALRRYDLVNFGFQELLRYRHNPITAIPLALFALLMTIALGFVCRIVSVAYWFVRRPDLALQAMPKNWVRQAFCVDSYAPPEIVPGEDTFVNEIGFEDADGHISRIRTNAEILTFRKVFLPKSLRTHYEQLEVKTWNSFEREPVDWKFRIFKIVFGLLLFAPAYFVPLLYRLSLKATCIVYAPFVWVAGITAGSADPLKVRLERLVKGQAEKYRRRFAGLIILIAGSKIALNAGWIDLKEAAHQALGSAKLVNEVLAPTSWPWWLIALTFDALVTFGLLIFTDAALARLDTRGKSYKRLVARVVVVVTYVRATVAVAAMSYLAAMAVVQLLPHRLLEALAVQNPDDAA